MLTLLTCLALSLQSSPDTISPADVSPDARFGASIVIDGDTAIVGASADSTGGPQAGSVHFYERSGANWVRAQVIRGTAGDRLGANVALDGDFAAVAHGFPYRLIEVFERQSGIWAQVDLLPYPGDPVSSPQFGVSLDLSGQTLAVGAPTASEGGTLGGAVYLYERTAAGWQGSETFSAVPAGSGFPISPNLGRKVTLQGDTLVASAPNASTGGVFSAGELRVYRRVLGTWTQVDALTQPSGLIGTGLGGSGLKLDGDRLVASAVGYDRPPFLSAGIVHVFEQSGGSWGHVSAILDPRPSHYAAFGQSVALQGDRIFVGRSEYHVRELSDFDVNVEAFRRTAGGSWTRADTLPNPNPGPLQGYGHTIAFDRTTLMIPSAYGVAEGERRGKIHLATYPGPWETVADLVCPGTVCACPTSEGWTGCGNSTRQEGRLFAAGSTSIAADDLEVLADRLPANQTAFLRMGPALGAPSLLGEGNICVQAGIDLMLQTTSLDGTITLTSGVLAQAMSGGTTVLPGETWFLQLIYSDPERIFRCRTYPSRPGFGLPWNGRPLLTAGGFNVTNALAVTWRP